MLYDCIAIGAFAVACFVVAWLVGSMFVAGDLTRQIDEIDKHRGE